MLIVLAGIAGLGLATAIVTLFVHWERTGQEQLVPLVLIGMLVVEATLYNDPNSLPRGLFHPGSGATQLRLPGLLHHARTGRPPHRAGQAGPDRPAGRALAAFGAWMAVGAVEGSLYRNSFSRISTRRRPSCTSWERTRWRRGCRSGSTSQRRC